MMFLQTLYERIKAQGSSGPLHLFRALRVGNARLPTCSEVAAILHTTTTTTTYYYYYYYY